MMVTQAASAKASLHRESSAVARARAHVQAWSTHDFDSARSGLAPDVEVTVTTTKPIMPDTRTVGIDEYMSGLISFAGTVAPGSLQLLASVGDERNALLLLTVDAEVGAGTITLPAARLYLFDEDDKIKVEQVVFLVPD
jgi:SnoaL-like domain